MVWSVLVSMVFGCDLGAPKRLAADEAQTTSRAKGGEDAVRVQRLRALAEGEARLQSGRAMERPAVEPAPPPAAMASPVAASSPRKHAISDNALDGLMGGYRSRESYASKATASLHRSSKAKANTRHDRGQCARKKDAPPDLTLTGHETR